MRLLLDQGLPRSTVLHLQNYGIEAVHVGDRGLAAESDSNILNFGQQEGMVVVTLDADFHTLLALSGLTGPSIIRIRIESLRGEALAKLVVSPGPLSLGLDVSDGGALVDGHGMVSDFCTPSGHFARGICGKRLLFPKYVARYRN